MASITSIIENLSDGDNIKAVGYKTAPNDFSIDGPKSYRTAFGMMVDVLSGVEAVVAINGSPQNIPNVDNKFRRGTREHANEVCATLEQIEDDIFATHDNGVTFIAIGSEANEVTVTSLLT